jgi:putative ATP-grasp target RiPP
MTTPFALSYAQPRAAEPNTPFTYDPSQQLNVCGDGSRAADNWPVLMSTASTTSTAGSQTHNDDD